MTMAGGEASLGRLFDDPATQYLVAMAGLPASGKSTIAGLLAARLGAPVVSVDPIEAAILAAGIDADQPTGLAAYLVAATIAEEILESGRSVVVDAVNAVEPARLTWRDLAERTGARLRVIEVACLDEALHAERLAKRAIALEALERDRAVEQSVEDYAEWKGPCAELPRITLDTSQPLGRNIELAVDFLAS